MTPAEQELQDLIKTNPELGEFQAQISKAMQNKTFEQRMKFLMEMISINNADTLVLLEEVRYKLNKINSNRENQSV